MDRRRGRGWWRWRWRWGGPTEPPSEGERAKAKKMKDNAINKIYKITNNALGISLIVTQPYYAEVCKAGSLWFVSLLRYRLR